MSKKEIALAFQGACDAGKGWDVCQEWCTPTASFECQADALAELGNLEAYVEWAKGLLTPVPDARAEVKACAVDEERGVALVFCVFHGTQTGEGGPVPATNKAIASDYVYALSFDGDKIKHMHKCWNDGHGLKQLGWV